MAGISRQPGSTDPGRLKTRHVSMIAFGGIVGAGLFVGSSVAVAGAGPAVLLGYIATGALVMVVLRALGEMLLAVPGRGSFIDYIRLGNGEWAGFLSGWLYWFYWVIVIGSEAIAGAILLQDWVPLPIWMLAVLLVLLVKLINMISVDLFGECEFWLAAVKLVCVVGFIGTSLLFVLHGLGHAPHVMANLLTHGGPMPHGALAIVGMIPTILFSMMGSETATVAAAETENAEANIARVTRSTAMRISLFYVSSIGLILCSVPWADIVPGHSPFVTAMVAMGIPGAALIIQLVVFSAIFSCLNSSIYITSRVLLGLATAGEAPRWFGGVSARGVPTRAVVVSSLSGLLVAFSSILAPDTIFAFLLGASGAVILLVYMLIVTAHLAVRGGLERAGHRFAFPTLPFFPWLNYVVVAGMGGIYSAMLLDQRQRATALSSLGCALFVLALYGVRRYAALRRSRGAGPVAGAVLEPRQV
ncbi:amino acid permease [Gluconacetobacter azotocaptans]|uniref:Amino acid permease n=1 Tax=Gluconacetobacter azotocaptans TaxID=142834 RepID=A0A7W4PF94_9PROT|nr:amino acid permease [Gluconacetobacter azotocaptans]MBB2188656.1 amino acid permease [Gluconacetobacter azotocaptans]MBM9400418.1 amino acid permease [Gluconacetobacter azotocaptans]